jgi:hypothetical protein
MFFLVSDLTCDIGVFGGTKEAVVSCNTTSQCILESWICDGVMEKQEKNVNTPISQVKSETRKNINTPISHVKSETRKKRKYTNITGQI